MQKGGLFILLTLAALLAPPFAGPAFGQCVAGQHTSALGVGPECPAAARPLEPGQGVNSDSLCHFLPPPLRTFASLLLGYVYL